MRGKSARSLISTDLPGFALPALVDLNRVAFRNHAAVHNLSPHPSFATMHAMECLVDIQISAHAGLCSIDHRAANAPPARNQLCRADADRTIGPGVSAASFHGTVEKN